MDIKKHIAQRQKEKRTHLLVLDYIEKLNSEVSLKESTMNDVRARISSKVAFCDRSIDDHAKLLK